jgi:hypothetical protein
LAAHASHSLNAGVDVNPLFYPTLSVKQTNRFILNNLAGVDVEMRLRKRARVPLFPIESVALVKPLTFF